MPGAKLFIDSNVLLYARDRAMAAKAEASNAWLRAAVREGAACANLQVLNEVASVMLRKRQDLATAEVFATVDDLGFLGRTPLTELTVQLGRRVRGETGYSWWDCLLVAAAIELGCTHFLSEDLQDGRTVGDVTIVDPFVHHPDEILDQR
jgi:predicted nucleic acid-binding protein